MIEMIEGSRRPKNIRIRIRNIERNIEGALLCQNGAGQAPFYHCELEGCHNEQGNSRQMYAHLTSYQHKQVVD
jgi:hypothetical protein